jgi:hypothetical protein
MAFELGYPPYAGTPNASVSGVATAAQRITIKGEWYIASTDTLSDIGFVVAASPVIPDLYNQSVQNADTAILPISDYGWAVCYSPSNAPLIVEGFGYGTSDNYLVSDGASPASYNTYGELRVTDAYYRLTGWKETTLWNTAGTANDTNGNIYGAILEKISGPGGTVLETLFEYCWTDCGGANRQEIGAGIGHYVYDNTPYTTSLNSKYTKAITVSIAASDQINQTGYSANPNPADAYTTAVLAYSPTFHYVLSEKYGLKAWDSSDNANHGAYTNYQYGQYFGAPMGYENMGLPGPNAGVTSVGDITGNNNNHFYVESPVNLTGTAFTLLLACYSENNWADNNPRIMSTAQTDTNHNGFELAVGAADGPSGFEIIIGDGSTTAYAGVSPAPSDTAWYLVGATYDGATLSMYVNGVSVSSNATTLSMTAGTNNVRIGSASGYNGGDFKGNVSYATVIPSALTAAEMLTLYNTWKGL